MRLCCKDKRNEKIKNLKLKREISAEVGQDFLGLSTSMIKSHWKASPCTFLS